MTAIPPYTQLESVINSIANTINKTEEPDSKIFACFFQEPLLTLSLVDYIDNLPEESMLEGEEHYSAAVFAMDICVANFQNGAESNSRGATKFMEQLMNYMAEVILNSKHSISFWLPVLSAFYEVQVELTPALQNAYFELASQEEETTTQDYDSYLNAIRDLINDLSDLSSFDIAENFFAQSYAMPPEFFADLIDDLYNIEEGKDIALLALLHPKYEVREIVLACMDELVESVTFSSPSLSRLKAISYWFPKEYQPRFQRWLKTQRKKGVTFAQGYSNKLYSIKASEVDGGGSQGIFLEFKAGRGKYKLGGLLLTASSGIKDVWMTPEISRSEIKHYYQEAFDGSVTLRTINLEYFQQIIEHFLALSMEKGQTPSLHLLEIQEECGGIQFHPQKIDPAQELEQLGILITPFTSLVVSESLQRSKNWTNTKSFTESWFEENSQIDKLVNSNCTFVDGIKVCNFETAIQDVFAKDMEKHRDKWLFHFLWMALWLRAGEKKTEKLWQDCFFIAYTIHQGRPLHSIPLMQEIAHQSVVNSVETMQDRKTHLQSQRAS